MESDNRTRIVSVFAILGAIAAIGAAIANFLVVPEFRRAVGLDPRSSSQSSNPNQPATTPNQDQTAVSPKTEVPSASTGRGTKSNASIPKVETKRGNPPDNAPETPRPDPSRSRPDMSSPNDATGNASEESDISDATTLTQKSVQTERRVPPTCSQANTGHFGFTNTTSTVFTVIVYFREGSDSNRMIIVRPGQTQYVYDFPGGGHNYLVTYRAQVPIMSFPPGAPTMEQDVIYLRGQIYVEQCKSGIMEIK